MPSQCDGEKIIIMAKTVKIHEKCIFTGTGGARALVASAKEALTTLDKNNVDVYIFLTDTPKDDAEKFLKEHQIPYHALVTKDDHGDMPEKPDACVLPSEIRVIMFSQWNWTLDEIVRKLYSEKEDKTEQEKMDDSFKKYLKWAKEAHAEAATAAER